MRRLAVWCAVLAAAMGCYEAPTGLQTSVAPTGVYYIRCAGNPTFPVFIPSSPAEEACGRLDAAVRHARGHEGESRIEDIKAARVILLTEVTIDSAMRVVRPPTEYWHVWLYRSLPERVVTVRTPALGGRTEVDVRLGEPGCRFDRWPPVEEIGVPVSPRARRYDPCTI